MNFLCDSMLGKLARLLRMCGFDTIYIKSGLNLENIKEFENFDRIVLTRNTKFKKYKGKLTIFFPDHDNPLIQLKTVLNQFNLVDKINFLSLCMECNVPLVKIDKELVRGKVPFFVFDTHNEFYYCPSCHRYYWEGSHVSKMKEKLKGVIGWQ
ncbi:MAG: Mut7-C RNAse domain-containing protein [candidate division WOR-3 bacterium]